MLDLSEFFAAPPFGWDRAEKTAHLIKALRTLQSHHESACISYRRISRMLGAAKEIASAEDCPIFPVRLFKMVDLRSGAADSTLKTITSSGTTGQAVSRIHLDKETAILQTKALVHIVKDFIGNKRLPMVIVDSKSVLKDPKMFSARGAGILGFSNFGCDHFYALNERFELDIAGLLAFLDKHQGTPILFFGFTFMLWQNFCRTLEQSGTCLELDNAIVIHGGGWKKLIDQAVDRDIFNEHLRNVCGSKTRVHNFYGMVEQAGSIYMECAAGHLHASNFSQIIIRDPISFIPLGIGQSGVVETISVLTWSYPGHVLLTEDMGKLLGEDDCRCGRHGRYFAIQGRMQEAELRGCSDTYALAQ